MRLLVPAVLACVALSAAHAQTLEERAAEVARTLAPPPDGTVMEVTRVEPNRLASPAPAPATNPPAAQPRQVEALTLPPELAERMNMLSGRTTLPQDPRGAAILDDPRGAIPFGAAQGPAAGGAPGVIPYIVTRPQSSTAVRGAGNLVTTPFDPGVVSNP